MNVLGLSCFYHDSAACLVRDGEIIAAVEEERLTRQKHDSGFPAASIDYVLKQGGISGRDLDAVIFYEKPLTKCERMFQTAHSFPDGSAEYLTHQLQNYTQSSLLLPQMVVKACGYTGELGYCEHHLSHAASVFYGSPFAEAAILIVDGVGEWATTGLYLGNGTTIKPLQIIRYPHSLGLLYAALTAFIGFEVNEGEYKVMGLAPYGKPVHLDKLHKLIKLNVDGSFALDLSYFNFMFSRTEMFSLKLIDLLGPPRAPESPMTSYYMDLAASLQALIEQALLGLAKAARTITGARYLCLAGGVAHNIVANARIKKSGLFDAVHIHFASGDSGGAIGAALYGYHVLAEKSERHVSRANPYLGPSYMDEEIIAALEKRNFAYEVLDRETLLNRTAELLADDFVIGWYQGRMEFGPRALGHRSILANAACADMKNILNARVKFREEFRPFAPAVLADRASEFFELDGESPSMLYAAQVRKAKQKLIPSITHVDGSARPQTVQREDNPLFYDLIERFANHTGIPVLVNTSFNIRGEPIVCSPDDALNCFAGTDIDFLVLGSALVSKEAKS